MKIYTGFYPSFVVLSCTIRFSSYHRRQHVVIKKTRWRWLLRLQITTLVMYGFSFRMVNLITCNVSQRPQLETYCYIIGSWCNCAAHVRSGHVVHVVFWDVKYRVVLAVQSHLLCLLAEQPEVVACRFPSLISHVICCDDSNAQTVVTQYLHMLQGESHVSRSQIRSLCNGICRICHVSLNVRIKVKER